MTAARSAPTATTNEPPTPTEVDEVDSIVRLVQSRIDVSLERLLE